MDQVPPTIIDEWVYLHGVSPDKRTWVNFDIEETPEGRFHIAMESSPEIGFTRGHSSEDYGSQKEALSALQKMIQDPSFRLFEFGLAEVKPIRVVAERVKEETPQTTVGDQTAPHDETETPTQLDRGIRDNSDNHRVENLTAPADVPGEPSNGSRGDAEKPVTTGTAYAVTAGVTGGFFGYAIPDFIEMFAWLSPISELPGFQDDVGDAVTSFRDFGEAANLAAVNENEVAGTLSSAVGALGPDYLSPSSKARAATTGASAGKRVLVKLALTAIERKAAREMEKRAAMAALRAMKQSDTYKKLLRRGLKEQPIKPSAGSFWQKWVSKKDYEYVADLQKSVTKDGINTVQIDDLVPSADGKVVVQEMKFMREGTEIHESGHVKFAKDKIEHLKRLFQYYKENSDAVSHIEIAVNRREAMEIYANIIASEIPEMRGYLGTVITFWMP